MAAPPSSAGQAAEDVAQVASVDRDMELIDAKFNAQGMLAFGASTEQLKPVCSHTVRGTHSTALRRGGYGGWGG